MGWRGGELGAKWARRRGEQPQRTGPGGEGRGGRGSGEPPMNPARWRGGEPGANLAWKQGWGSPGELDAEARDEAKRLGYATARRAGADWQGGRGGDWRSPVNGEAGAEARGELEPNQARTRRGDAEARGDGQGDGEATASVAAWWQTGRDARACCCVVGGCIAPSWSVRRQGPPLGAVGVVGLQRDDRPCLAPIEGCASAAGVGTLERGGAVCTAGDGFSLEMGRHKRSHVPRGSPAPRVFPLCYLPPSDPTAIIHCGS